MGRLSGDAGPLSAVKGLAGTSRARFETAIVGRRALSYPAVRLSFRRRRSSCLRVSVRNNSSADQPLDWAYLARSNRTRARPSRVHLLRRLASLSKPARRAFLSNFSARSRAGRCLGMPSRADGRAWRVPCFFGRLIFSQLAQTWSTFLTLRSPKTWG